MADMPPGKVKPIQEMLNKIIKPKPALEVDGILGKNSIAALKQFQKQAGLKESGQVDAETAPAVARAIKTGKIEKDQPTVYVDIGGGKYAGFSDGEWKTEQKKMTDKLLSGPVREAKMKAAEAKSTWEHFNELNKDQYIVSFFVEATRGASLPAKGAIEKAEKAASDLEALAKAQDFAGFMRRARTGSGEINTALDEMRKYRESMIDGAGNWVTGLETTKWASFTVLSIYAAPAAAASLGTGALASAVIGGAAVKGLESAAGEIGNWSAGNAKGQDPGGAVSRVLIDTAVGAVTGWLSKGAGGKAVGEAIITKITAGIGAKLALQGASAKVLEAAAKYFLNEGAKKMLEGAVADAAKALKGDPKMTVSAFVDNVAANFVKGCAFGPFNEAFKKFSAGKTAPIPEGDRKKLEKQIVDKVMKELGDDNVMLQTVQKELQKGFDKLAADTLGKAMSKAFEKAAMTLFETLKGPPNQKAIEDKLQAEILTPQTLNECRDAVAEQLIKDLKKKNKK